MSKKYIRIHKDAVWALAFVVMVLGGYVAAVRLANINATKEIRINQIEVLKK